MAVGMKVDRRNRLFVAGGPRGTASVYDARTGKLLKRYTLTTAPTFVNDVIVTEHAAYFTDSQQAAAVRARLRPPRQAARPGARRCP